MYIKTPEIKSNSIRLYIFPACKMFQVYMTNCIGPQWVVRLLAYYQFPLKNWIDCQSFDEFHTSPTHPTNTFQTTTTFCQLSLWKLFVLITTMMTMTMMMTTIIIIISFLLQLAISSSAERADWLGKFQWISHKSYQPRVWDRVTIDGDDEN